MALLPPNLYSASVFSSRPVFNIAICTVVGESRESLSPLLSDALSFSRECLFYYSLEHKQLKFTIDFTFRNRSQGVIN